MAVNSYGSRWMESDKVGKGVTGGGRGFAPPGPSAASGPRVSGCRRRKGDLPGSRQRLGTPVCLSPDLLPTPRRREVEPRRAREGPGLRAAGASAGQRRTGGGRGGLSIRGDLNGPLNTGELRRDPAKVSRAVRLDGAHAGQGSRRGWFRGGGLGPHSQLLGWRAPYMILPAVFVLCSFLSLCVSVCVVSLICFTF